MGWKATGQPTVRRQRDKWVVRVDGIHTETGRHRPRQLGTYPSQRSARSAASKLTAEGAEGGGKGTVGLLVNRWVAAKTDITEKSQMQNRWAAGHISKALGAIRLEQLDRADIDFDAGTVRIDEALIEVEGRPVWTEGKNERSRRTFGLDADTLARLVEHRSRQDEERLLAGNDWDDQNLLLSTRTGNRVSPGNFDQTLDRLVKRAGVPRLTSHGRRRHPHGPSGQGPR